MLKVGLIGCGGMGNTHMNCYAALKDTVCLSAVADLDSKKTAKAAKISGAAVYTSGEELLNNENDLDIIDICLPTYLHTEYAVKAMKKGFNVFLEKPVCLNREEAELLLKTQKETSVKVQVGQVIRFWDEYAWLKNAVKEHKYGKVLSAVFKRLSPNPKWSWQNWYNDYEKSGTMALDLHIHDVDFVRYLMDGEPDEVFSHATRDDDGVIQQIFSSYKYGDAVITTEGCWDYPDNYPFTMAYRVKMEHATAVFEGSTLTVYTKDGKNFKPELQPDIQVEGESTINVSGTDAYYNEIKYFADCIANGKEPVMATLEDACKSLKLALTEISLAGGAKNKNTETQFDIN